MCVGNTFGDYFGDKKQKEYKKNVLTLGPNKTGGVEEVSHCNDIWRSCTLRASVGFAALHWCRARGFLCLVGWLGRGRAARARRAFLCSLSVACAWVWGLVDCLGVAAFVFRCAAVRPNLARCCGCFLAPLVLRRGCRCVLMLRRGCGWRRTVCLPTACRRVFACRAANAWGA
jgi:hypothetical protein